MAASTSRTPTFRPDKSLLNPHFEAYKLDVSEYNSKVYRLPSPASYQSDVLGFQELKDRHNQPKLVPGSIPGQLAYIDNAGFVVLIVINKNSRPSFQPLHNIFQGDVADADRLSTASSSLCSLADGQWLVCNGRDTIDLLSTSKSAQSTQRWSARVKHSFVLPTSTTGPLGIRSRRLLDARIDNDGEHVIVLVQSARKVSTADARSDDNSKSTTSTTRSTTKTVFDVSLYRLSLNHTADSPLRQISSVTGPEPVYYSILGTAVNGPHTVMAEGEFSSSEDNEQASRGTFALPSGSSQDTIRSPSASSPPPSKRQRASPPSRSSPPPFSWMQTPDSVTVLFRLPPTLLKTDFRVHFSHQGLSLSLAQDVLNATNSDTLLHDAAQSLANDTYTSRSLWAPIDPSNSVWTWEKVQGTGDKHFGLLTLHLEKKHEGTRWVQVFEHDEDNHPPETMDPSDLLTMVQGLDKYTSDGRGDEVPISRPGGIDEISSQRDSLLHDALEPEDAIVGRRAVLNTLTADRTLDSDPTPRYSLAESLPTSTSTSNPQAPAMVIRHDLDGLVYSYENDGQWTHKDTLPALSFVLASKRDMNKVYVHRNQRANYSVVLAFENAPRVGGAGADSTGAGNLFVYYSDPEPRQMYGRSRVIRLDSSSGCSTETVDTGALMGVAVTSYDEDSDGDKDGGGEEVLVCLCERSVILLTGVL